MDPTREPGALSPRPALRWIGYAVGVLLLGGAIAVVWRHRETVGAALEAGGAVTAGQAAALVGAIVANVVLSAALLRHLLSRYGQVGVFEMPTIVAAATLMNYLPLRPGLFGRVAYHRAVNGIPVVSTTRTVIEAVVLTTGTAVYLASVAIISMRWGLPLWIGVLAPLPVLAIAAILGIQRHWAIAGLLRHVEVLVWALRYHIAFAIIGAPIDATAAIALACSSVIATMVPFISNGLGLREWAVGLLAPPLAGCSLELGVAAELVNRAAEILVMLTLGLASLPYLTRRLREATMQP